MSYDVIVLGGGAAGTAAAMMLRSRGLEPILVERSAKPSKKLHRPDWISTAGTELLERCGVSLGELRGKPFSGMTFHSADLKKTATASGASGDAWRVDHGHVIERMHEAAREAGVKTLYRSGPARIELGEKRVKLSFEERDPIEGGFLLLADGAARTFATVGLGQTPPVVAAPSSKASGRWVATLEFSVAGKGREAKSAADTNMHWLVGVDREQGCLLWWWEGASLVASLFARGTGDAVAALLASTVNRLVAAGLLGAAQPVGASAVHLRPAPARSALEIDSHVEKRCLLIGDAGGFISETSGEGVYPAVWSAQLAVDSVVAARTSPHPQDQLRQFSVTWRSTMAEFLRPPHTDMHFLLPLIFSNRQMADRMAGAFWRGLNI